MVRSSAIRQLKWGEGGGVKRHRSFLLGSALLWSPQYVITLTELCFLVAVPGTTCALHTSQHNGDTQMAEPERKGFVHSRPRYLLVFSTELGSREPTYPSVFGDGRTYCVRKGKPPSFTGYQPRSSNLYHHSEERSHDRQQARSLGSQIAWGEILTLLLIGCVIWGKFLN